MNKKKYMKYGLTLFVTAFLFAVTSFLLVWNGVIFLNNPSLEEYPVRGVDVSSYQGNIEWEILASQNISFAFIKATEGSSFVDPYFEYNYTEAQKTKLRIGAYHFFSYDSPGKTQADNFIKVVEKHEGMLPPVIDLEFYADKAKNPPEQSEVRKELDDLINELELHYEMKPIIYATKKSYVLYLEGAYKDYDIWIRDVLTKPRLSDNRKWVFWQYTDRKYLAGYKGKEKYIDMNVFNGTMEMFEYYAR